MRARRIALNFGALIIVAAMILLMFLKPDSYVEISAGILLLSIVFLLVRFESRKVEARELVLLAVLAAIAVVGRIAFASLPSVKPTTFVIMMSGLVFGAESGFIIGAVAALASNMIFGQGPWTPWQMIAWGLVGYTAGLLRNTAMMRNIWGKIVFGLLWGFLFGWIMNIWGFLALVQTGGTWSIHAFVTYFAGSALFDLMHALSNVFFLLVFGKNWLKILTRFKRKYGLLE
ncbi:MAG: ECF transporter S component [Bacillota bacterium]|nr:ECF transporter S component [Bacillota bacterium]